MFGMNIKRLSLSIIVLFIFVFVYEWIFHGMVMGALYQETASLWRSEAEMQQRFGWMVFGQLFFAGAFCKFYARFYTQEGGWLKGAEFGFWVSMFMVASNFIMYAVAPYTLELLAYWAVGGILEGVLAGAIVGSLYRP